jgi:hypothetical protein
MTVLGRAGRATALAAHVGWCAATRRLVELPTADITDEFAFGLGGTGWHPLRAFLADADAGTGGADPAQGDYGRFFRSPAVTAVGTLADVLSFHDPAARDRLAAFWLGTYPWGGLTRGDDHGTPFGWAYDEATGADTSALWGRNHTPWYLPGDEATIAVDTGRTLALHASIGRDGYSPLRARGWPRVCLLARPDGARRGVIIDGHHRLAVLAHRGVRSTRVEIDRVVRRSEAADWPAVRSSMCSRSEALAVFDAFFELDGSERYDAARRSWEDPACREVRR